MLTVAVLTLNSFERNSPMTPENTLTKLIKKLKCQGFFFVFFCTTIRESDSNEFNNALIVLVFFSFYAKRYVSS